MFANNKYLQVWWSKMANPLSRIYRSLKTISDADVAHFADAMRIMRGHEAFKVIYKLSTCISNPAMQKYSEPSKAAANKLYNLFQRCRNGSVKTTQLSWRNTLMSITKEPSDVARAEPIRTSLIPTTERIIKSPHYTFHSHCEFREQTFCGWRQFHQTSICLSNIYVYLYIYSSMYLEGGVIEIKLFSMVMYSVQKWAFSTVIGCLISIYAQSFQKLPSKPAGLSLFYTRVRLRKQSALGELVDGINTNQPKVWRVPQDTVKFTSRSIFIFHDSDPLIRTLWRVIFSCSDFHPIKFPCFSLRYTSTTVRSAVVRGFGQTVPIKSEFHLPQPTDPSRNKLLETTSAWTQTTQLHFRP